MIKKLRLKAGTHGFLVNPPAGYHDSLGELPEGATLSLEGDGKFAFVQIFLKDREEFDRLIPGAINAVEYDGLLWVCYPKKGAKTPSDLSRDLFWEMMEPFQMRPVSQIAIDETWSALRFRPEELVGR